MDLSTAILAVIAVLVSIYFVNQLLWKHHLDVYQRLIKIQALQSKLPGVTQQEKDVINKLLASMTNTLSSRVRN